MKGKVEDNEVADLLSIRALYWAEKGEFSKKLKLPQYD